MYCPRCNQPQISAETRFCSHCGLALVSGGAEHEAKHKKPELAPRQRGMRQGAVLMMLSVILIPAYILLAALFPANDRLIESAVSDTPFEKISQAVLFTIFMLGLARLAYARFFQSGSADEQNSIPGQLNSSANYSLPPSAGPPVSGFGTWRETGEIVKPSKIEQ
ncbi:MAG TPA: zinc ribbon domain-containing protein [Pyrinomonadaceae bacterium]|nr:zinc ribbon domain-containing protein [Pyrinomonadaceae bacterium]